LNRRRLIFWSLAVVLGLLQVWAHRSEMNPDGISYIELGWTAARSGLHQIVNGYWSPLYPFLLNLVFHYLNPPPQWEFTAAHLLNFAVYLASLAAFELFLEGLLITRFAAEYLSQKSTFVESGTLRVWGYVFFLWASYFWLGPVWVTPDLCVSVIVFLAMAVLLRIRRSGGKGTLFAVLGGLLGLGYLAKAAMFPLSFVFLFSAFLLSWRAGASLRAATLYALLAAGVFAVVAGPFILSLSLLKGRPTFGDSARINYMEYVDAGPKWIHWQGKPEGTGTPRHPTRKVFSDPDIYEFSSWMPASYAPWYDPSYWYDGAQPHFLWTGQSLALFRAANMYLKIFSNGGALWVVLAVVLWLLYSKLIALKDSVPGEWLITLPLVAPLAMYALVHVEFRFIAPFGLMLLIRALTQLSVVAGTQALLLKRSLMVVTLAPALAMAWPVAHDLRDVVANRPYEPWRVAVGLHEMGIPPGTRVGSIGTGLSAYWAHLAGVRIIAEIPEKDETIFLAANPTRKLEALSKFSEVGAKAVLTKNAAVAHSMDGWQQVGQTNYYVWRAHPS
jgi:hypothetical protein